MADKIIVEKQGGIGFMGILQIVFIVLKLLGVINWSWLLVLLPIIIPLSITLLIFVVALIIGVIVGIAKK